MENLRKNLGGQQWFRFLSDQVFGRRWVLCLLGAGSIPLFLPFVVPESPVLVLLLALGALCYLCTLLGQLILGLDPYEQQAGQHWATLMGELLLLPALLIARQLGYLEQLTRLLF